MRFSLAAAATLFMASTVVAIPFSSAQEASLQAREARLALGDNEAAVAHAIRSLQKTQRRSVPLRTRATDPVNQIMDTLKSSVSEIASKITSIAQAAPSTDPATTTSAMNDENSALEQALNTALSGVTKLVGQVKGDVDLLNLAQTITDVIADLEPALVTVEGGLAEDPALAPLITSLAATLNGPLFSLLTALNGLLDGLLPVVQGLLAGLGLTPVLASVQGLVDTLLTALGA